MKPRYRVTSAPIGTSENKLWNHAQKFEWWVSSRTEITLVANIYSIAIAVQVMQPQRILPEKNYCEVLGNYCGNRGCGMFHEHCFAKQINYQKPIDA